jgi:hypothetical protein
MKILVSGSLRGVDDGRKPGVRTAAEELGKAVAAAGHTLLVGSEDPDDVDPYAVEGFASADSTSQVQVHLQKNAPRCYVGKQNITNCWHRYDDWDVTVGIAAGFLTAALYMLAQIAITGRIGYEQC